jgi:pyrroline-5-carboxylate reductase
MMLEALIDTGVHMGLPRGVSTKLVSKTFQGSIQYFLDSKNQHPVQMRNDITSPGGACRASITWWPMCGISRVRLAIALAFSHCMSWRTT